MQRELELYIRGNELSKLGKYNEAIGCYNKSLEIRYNKKITTRFKKMTALIGRIFMKEKQLYKRGGCLFDLGRYKKAIIFYDKVLEINPKHEGALYDKKVSLHNIGGSLAHSEKYEEALIYYDEALKVALNDNLNKDTLFFSGLCLMFLRRYDEALTHYDKALKLDPNYDEKLGGNRMDGYMFFCKGIGKAKLGLYEEALIYFNNALESDDHFDLDRAKTIYNKSFCLAKLKKYKEAASCIKKGFLLIRNEEREFLRDGIKAFNNPEEYRNTAEYYFNNVLEINSENRDALFYKGNIFICLKDYMEAIICFDKILEINPKDADSLQKKIFCLKSIFHYYNDIYLVRYGNYYNFFRSYEKHIALQIFFFF